ncbi:hypothetical protein MVEG_10101 [Podila verticillata NRRL 6337]|nr:hypothetical protein MVEG_10101 [Podila verticillata NRRL 6337]
MQQDHSSASSSNTSSSSSSTTTTNSSVTAATPTTTVTSSPISSTSSTRRLFRPSSSFAPCITSAHIRPNTNPNPILDYGSTSTDLPNPSSTHPAPPSSVALSSGLTSDDISSTPSEEALISTESPGGRSYIPSIEDTISSPGVDTNTRYVCAQSDPSLIDYTSHQYAQVGGNKDVGRGSDEASYEHPERYHATEEKEEAMVMMMDKSGAGRLKQYETKTYLV